MNRVCLTVIALFVLSCAASQSGNAGSKEKQEPLLIARYLSEKGEYLHASYYYEAALDEGASELEYLPALIDSQVRSGRLLASLSSLERFCELQPENREARKFYILIKKIIESEQTSGLEIERWKK